MKYFLLALCFLVIWNFSHAEENQFSINAEKLKTGADTEKQEAVKYFAGKNSKEAFDVLSSALNSNINEGIKMEIFNAAMNFKTEDKYKFDAIAGAIDKVSVNSQWAILKSIHRIKDPRLIDLLSRKAQEGNEGTALQCVVAMGNIGDTRATEFLIAGLKSNSRLVKAFSAVSLGKLKDKRAVAPIIEALHDPDEYVREKAAIGAGDLGDIRMAPYLEKLLSDPAVETKKKAIEALGKLKSREAVEKIIKLLEDEDEFVRTHAAGALGEILDRRGIKPLIKRLDDKSWYVRCNSALSLGKFGDRELAKKYLYKPLNDVQSEVRIYTAGGLGYIVHNDSLELLRDRLILESDEKVIKQLKVSIKELEQKLEKPAPKKKK